MLRNAMIGALTATFVAVSAASAQPAQTTTPPGGDLVDLTLNFLGTNQGAGPTHYEIAGGAILIPVRLGGRQTWAMIDNRSERSLTDESFARAAGLTIAPANGTVETPLGQQPKRRVDVALSVTGQFDVTGWPTGAVDLKPLSARLGREVLFVLGEDFFSNLAVFLDPSKSEVRFAPSNGFNMTSEAPPIALRDGAARLNVTVGGTPMIATIDLSYPGVARLTPQAWSRLGQAAPTDGRALLPRLEFAPFTGNDLPAEIANMPARDGELVLGLGLFNRMMSITDVPAGRLFIGPLPGPPPAPARPTAP